MNDNDILESLFDSIKEKLEELDVFEQEVLKRPKTPGKQKLLDSIRVNRKKLSDLASSALQ